MRNLIFVLCLAAIGCAETATPMITVETCASDIDCRNGYHCNLHFMLCEPDEEPDGGTSIVSMDDGGGLIVDSDGGSVDQDSGHISLPDSGEDVCAGWHPDLSSVRTGCFDAYSYLYDESVSTMDIDFSNDGPEGSVAIPLDWDSLPSDRFRITFEIAVMSDTILPCNVYVLPVMDGRRMWNTVPINRDTMFLRDAWNRVTYHVDMTPGSGIHMVIETSAGRFDYRLPRHEGDEGGVCHMADVPDGIYIAGGYSDQKYHVQIRNLEILPEDCVEI